MKAPASNFYAGCNFPSGPSTYLNVPPPRPLPPPRILPPTPFLLEQEVLDRAKELGFTGLALTADFSWVGNRERETRTGFTVPPSYSMRQCIDAIKSPAWTYDYMSRVPYGYKAVPDADFPAESLVDFIAAQMKPEFDWKDAEWLCSEWGDTGPVALKGVARGGDAVRAVETGFKSIWVSNHGGRQLEDSVATFDVLPEVRQ